MSPTAARIAAVPFGLLAFAGNLVAKFWITPLGWKLPFALSLVVYVGSFALTLIIPVVGYALLGRVLWGPPASLNADPGRNRFVVPVSPEYSGSMAIVWMGLASSGVLTERVPNGDAVPVAAIDHAVPVSVAAVSVFFLVAAHFLLVNRPRVTLEPAGLTVHRLGRPDRIRWDDLAPGGPPPPAERKPKVLRLHLNSPPIWGWHYPSKDLPVGRLHIDPAFLAGTVRHYVEQPWHRPAIGTEAELDRLRSVLVPPPVTAAGPT
jgi:hypothetical protein